jgi:hypothetical protein
LKKCVPSQCLRKSSLRPSASAAIGIPDVFELTIEPARLTASTWFKQRALGIELLDDGFDDPVSLADSLQIVVETPRGDQGGCVRRKKMDPA